MASLIIAERYQSVATHTRLWCAGRFCLLASGYCRTRPRDDLWPLAAGPLPGGSITPGLADPGNPVDPGTNEN